MSARRQYRAFGITIRSELPLWPQAVASEPARVTPDLDVLVSSRVTTATQFSLSADETAAHLAGIGSIFIQGGERIEISPEAGVDDATLAACVTGLGLSMALQQRGALVLHGSSIAIHGEALCIAGPSGAGKSTLGGAALERGHSLISDGMTAIVLGADGAARALVGPRCARLWPDALSHLGWRVDTLPRALPDHDKRLCPLPEPGPAGPVRVGYVLETCAGEPPVLGALGASAGLMALVRNSFVVDFLDAASAPALLEHCSRVAASVRVGTLIRGTELNDLEATIGLLERLIETRALNEPRDAIEVASGR